MEKQLLLLAKLLGESYRIQKKLGMDVPVSKAQIYGLLTGFELVIEEELESMGFISSEKVEQVGQILDEYFLNDEKLAEFKGYYDIEPRLTTLGIDRSEARRIIKYFNADERFDRVIAKMDSDGSPSECRRFNLYDWDDVKITEA